MSKKPKTADIDFVTTGPHETKFTSFWRTAQSEASRRGKGQIPFGLVALAYTHMTPFALAGAYDPTLTQVKENA